MHRGLWIPGLRAGDEIAPLYGAFFVERLQREGGHSFFFPSVSLFDLEARFFVPTRAIARVDAQRSCQGWPSRDLPGDISALSRPYLDGFEHDGTLGDGRVTIRGEPPLGRRINRATTLYPVGSRGTRTMMQSCASVTKLSEAADPFSLQRVITMARESIRVTATSNRHRTADDVLLVSLRELVVLVQGLRPHAARNTTPSRNLASGYQTPQAQISNFARQTLRSLFCAFLPAPSVRVRYHWANALSF